MSVNTKPVFCAKYLSHGMFAGLLENDSAKKMATPKLSAAQVYRIDRTPGRTERRLAGE